MNLLPIFTGQIKATACDWAEENGRTGGLKESKRGRKRGRRKKRRCRTMWLGETASCKGLIAGGQAGVVIELTSLGT